jgi:lectin, mannose-binding 1
LYREREFVNHLSTTISKLVFQVSIHNGLTNNRDEFELCLRAENVELPADGYFGVSAATGGLAGQLFLLL